MSTAEQDCVVSTGEAIECLVTMVKGLECIAPLVHSVEETPEPVSAEVEGNIPAWLRGNLLRNGPGKFEFGNDHFNHWFDGMALLHQFKIGDGQVTYKSRFLQSDTYKANSEKNRIMVCEFGTLSMPDPCQSFFQRFLSRFEMIDSTDNASVNIVNYKGDYYVSTETNFMHRIDPEKLESVEKVDWSKFVAVNGATAHPHSDPDGTTYNMGNSYGWRGALYNIIQVPPERTEDNDSLQGAKILSSIVPTNRSYPSYYHSFGMSKNYVVFIEQPIKMNLWKIVTCKLRGKGLSDAIYWDPNLDTIFHVIDKHSGVVSSVKYHAKAMTTFHQINAFEEDGFLMLDLCCAGDGDVIKNYYIQNLRKSGEDLEEVYNTVSRPLPWRFVLPLNITEDTPTGANLNTRPSSQATCVKISPDKVFCQHEDLHGNNLLEYGGLEFPQINYRRCNGQQYRYIYGCGFRHLVGDSLLKMDLTDKSLKVWREDGYYPSEPVFIPIPDAVLEDDGILLSVVLSPAEDKSNFLLILDAKTFEELARAKVPVNIPYGFHGAFLASD